MRKSEEFERPILTVDVVLFTLFNGRLHVFLPKREREPFLGLPALVGGYIHTDEDEDTHSAAVRVLHQKHFVEVPYLEQLAMFSGKKRDPRGWSATMAYISMIPFEQFAAIDSTDFYPVDELKNMKLGFDHAIIVFWAILRLRSKSSYSSLPVRMMPPTFTLLELQTVYEAMMGTKMEKNTFRYKIKEMGVVEPTGQKSDPKLTGCRPADLYRATDHTLWFFNSGMTVTS